MNLLLLSLYHSASHRQSTAQYRSHFHIHLGAQGAEALIGFHVFFMPLSESCQPAFMQGDFPQHRAVVSANRVGLTPVVNMSLHQTAIMSSTRSMAASREIAGAWGKASRKSARLFFALLNLAYRSAGCSPYAHRVIGRRQPTGGLWQPAYFHPSLVTCQ